METSQKTKSRSRWLSALILSCAMIAQVFAFALPAQAATPRFNFQTNDWELLRGANRTTNQADWSDPVSGSAGDTFAGIIYYHNGILDSTAENTRVKISIPSETTNGSAVINAAIMADNADTITDTYIGGQLEGRSGLTVNLNEDARLSLVAGSVKWFPDFVSMSSSQKPLPLGQSGDEIIASSGLNLGPIQGCWEHVGYVTFLVKSERIAQPELTCDKTVRNLTMGETNFVKQNFAKPGDVLEYSIVVNNGGAGTAENLYLTDTIPANTTYVAGSSFASRNGGQFENIADGIIGDGTPLGTLAKDEKAEIRFKVKIGQGVANGQTLTNTAFLHVNKEVLTCTATTIVKFSIVTPPQEELPVTGANNVIISILAASIVTLAGTYFKLRKALKIAKF